MSGFGRKGLSDSDLQILAYHTLGGETLRAVAERLNVPPEQVEARWAVIKSTPTRKIREAINARQSAERE